MSDVCRFFLCAPVNSSVQVLAIKGVRRDSFVSFLLLIRNIWLKCLQTAYSKLYIRKRLDYYNIKPYYYEKRKKQNL